MRILIVVPEQDRISGNWISAQRFQQGLSERQHQVQVMSVSLSGGAACKQTVNDFAPDVALLLHAYRTGKPWLASMHDLAIPFVIMMTGTDINQGLEDSEQKVIIAESINKAAFVLLQNPLLAELFSTEHPVLAANVRIIKPGVNLGRVPYSLRETHNLDKDTPLFLCPAGIRPVKMQRQLLRIFDDVVANSPALQLAFCGPCLDKKYGEAFIEDIAERPWASYLGAINPKFMAAVMQEADVIMNNSLSEGLSNSLVEAATLGIPILARDNPGNRAVVKQGGNGLLYNQPAEGKGHIRSLLDPDYREQLSKPERSYVTRAEATDLETILTEAIKRFSNK